MSESAVKRKNKARVRTKIRIRKKIVGTEARPRMSIFKSGKHSYAQIVCDVTGKTLASASTLEKEVGDLAAGLSSEGLHSEKRSAKSVAAAKAVGILVARRGKEKNVSSVVFDRNGFVYKGRVKAIAEGAREEGLQL